MVDWELGNLQSYQRYLDAMSCIEGMSTRLGTISYIWGGWTIDIYRGQFQREHSDIDYLVVDLHDLFPRFEQLLRSRDWKVRSLLENHLLWASKDEVKLHLGHIGINHIVDWKHNGENGSIFFPCSWLRNDVVDFYGTAIHTVEPEFGYALKTTPSLMNPDWEPRERDLADIQVLKEILTSRGIDMTTLAVQVRST